MKLVINFSNRVAYTFLSLFMLILIVGTTIALNSGNYNIHGHDLGELGLPNCANGQVLKYQTDNGGWSCGTDLSFLEKNLVNGSVLGWVQLSKFTLSGRYTCESSWGQAVCGDSSLNPIQAFSCPTKSKVLDLSDYYFICVYQP